MSRNKLTTPAEADGLSILNFNSCVRGDREKYLAVIKKTERKSFSSNEVFDFDTELKKKNTNALVALKDAEVVAYLIYLRMKRLTLLHKICVVERYRQDGIAKAMMQFLFVQLKGGGCDYIQLWVDEDRKAARALYESTGFRQIDRYADYYGPGRTGCKLQKQLF